MDWCYLKWKPIPEEVGREMPRILTFTPIKGVCMFCSSPEGETHSLYIENLIYGFLTCGKEVCRMAAGKRRTEILNDPRWLRAQSFAHREIKVKRSSGIIENGWKLVMSETNPDSIHKKIGQDYFVRVTNETLAKDVQLDEFLELNEIHEANETTEAY